MAPARLGAGVDLAVGAQRRFVIFEVEALDAEVIGYESILHEGRAVGYVTSGAFGHCVGKSLAAGDMKALVVDAQPALAPGQVARRPPARSGHSMSHR